MKLKSILSVLIVCIISLLALLTGCTTYNSLKYLSGTWEIDFIESEESVLDSIKLDSIKSATIVIERLDAIVIVEYKYDYAEKLIESGNYKLDCKVHFDSVSGDIVSEKASISFDCVVDGSLRMEVGSNNYIYFKKSDSTDETVSGSKYAEIKTAYKNAGYIVDLSTDSVYNEDIAQIISDINLQFGMRGYNLCFMGKKSDDGSVFELYVLVSTDTIKETKALWREINDRYACKYYGKDLIAYIWGFDSPDFSYFHKVVD